MASITSLSNSSYNTSSIYGTRNVLSGLASGMDTETMIENAVSGIKMKIQNLIKKRTKVEWQQEAYRSIIDKAVNFSTKYTSYSSKTNLLSSSFFTNSVNTVAKGTYADKITATGKTSSDIKINAVKQMATSASYTVSGLGGLSGSDIAGIAGGKFDITGNTTVSTVSGMLTFQYGGTNGTSFDIRFDELEDLNEVEVLNSDGSVKEDATNAEKLAQAIRNKLSEITYSYKQSGVQETTTADKAINVTVEGGEIKFSDGLGNGNKVTISGGSGNIISTLDISKDDTSISGVNGTNLTRETRTTDYLSDKTLSLNFNGTTKSISMLEVLKNAGGSSADNEDFRKGLQTEIDKAFGAGKITVGWDGEWNEDGELVSGGLSFTPKSKGDTLSVSGTAVKAMGFESGDANYINTGKKLSDIFGEDFFNTTANRLKAQGIVSQVTNSAGTYYVDGKGNKVEMADDGNYYQVNDIGKAVYNFEINGTTINVTEDTTLEGLMGAINSNANAGVKVSYSKLTDEFKFTATETGSSSKIEFGGLAKDLFGASGSVKDSFSDAYGLGLSDSGNQSIQVEFDAGNKYKFNVTSDMTVEDVIEKLNKSPYSAEGYKASYDDLTGQIVMSKNGERVNLKVTSENDKGEAVELKSRSGASYTAGQDAILDVEINGVRFESLTRSSNSFDLDGLTVSVKGTFNEDGLNVGKDGADYEPITFQTTTDTEKIIDAIRDFVNDYNEMVTELKGAYSTQPNYNSSNERYDPLTAEEEAKYSESELAAYNEKAKQGILFGDTTLSSMYSKLLSAIQPGGTDGQVLREIGIGTSYDNGLTTLSLDEDKLRNALENDLDKVKDAFTKTRESGSSTDGLMQTLQNNLNTYVKTTGEPKGVLIAKAGSVKSPTSLTSNSLYSQITNIDKQISRWQDKMASQIDRYTTQFSRLEQLVAAMNAQASAMSGLMGGYEGY